MFWGSLSPFNDMTCAASCSLLISQREMLQSLLNKTYIASDMQQCVHCSMAVGDLLPHTLTQTVRPTMPCNVKPRNICYAGKRQATARTCILFDNLLFCSKPRSFVNVHMLHAGRGSLQLSGCKTQDHVIQHYMRISLQITTANLLTVTHTCADGLCYSHAARASPYFWAIF